METVEVSHQLTIYFFTSRTSQIPHRCSVEVLSHSIANKLQSVLIEMRFGEKIKIKINLNTGPQTETEVLKSVNENQIRSMDLSSSYYFFNSQSLHSSSYGMYAHQQSHTYHHNNLFRLRRLRSIVAIRRSGDDQSAVLSGYYLHTLSRRVFFARCNLLP